MTTLAQLHDCLLVDLDGTVYRGDEPTVGAVSALAGLAARTLFVTNNASRSAEQVAAHLCQLGFTADGDDVVTSAQVAAHLLAEEHPPGSAVLVVGTAALADEITVVGLRPVRGWRDKPVAVVQGHSTGTGWADLAEAAVAIRAGARWVATNIDPTLPSENGLLPGNGAMVAALQTATDAHPTVAGKPSPAVMTHALARGYFHAPLVVGDRLDTDIAAANAAELPSLMVLTGASCASDVVDAAPAHRPTHIGHDLRAVHLETDAVAIAPQPAWHTEIDGSAVTVGARGDRAPDDELSVVRAVADAVWTADVAADSVVIAAGDDAAHDALLRAGLPHANRLR